MPRALPPIDRACALHEQAALLRARGEPARARRAARQALAIFEAGDGPRSPDVANVLLAVAGAEHDLGRFGAALMCARRALAILDRLRGASADLAQLRVNALLAVARELVAAGEYRAARPLVRRALRVTLTHRLRDSQAAAWNLLGMVCKHTARWAAGARCYRRAIALLRGRPGSGLALASLLHNVAGLDHARGRFARAIAPARRGLALRQRLLGPGHPDVAADAAALAAILDGAGKTREAERLYRRALRVYERTLGPAHFEVGFNLGNLAALCQGAGRLAEAERLYARAIRIKRATLGRRHPDFAITLSNLAALRERQRRYPTAADLYAEAATLLAETVGRAHPDTKACAAHRDRLRRLAR